WACGSIKEIIIKKNKEWYLSALILGELFKEKKHSVNAEIKAVTFHQLEIRNISGKYSTRIVFDI
ncbi:MAG TPA: archease, partial [Ignavibacteriaceae bacterium]|nr:archease [Ignavibacteriaceae bacterium]